MESNPRHYVPPHLRNINSTNTRTSHGRHRGRGSGPGIPGPGVVRYSVLTRELHYPDESRVRTQNPFDIVDKFDELEVVDDGNGKDKNTGINFDAYEDIPVEVTGVDVPKPANSFEEIGLVKVLKDNIIRRCKYVKPTPIQRHAIPVVLAGRDLMACAQTGSGKTAAFCFPIINGIMKVRRPPANVPGGLGSVAYPLALILSPTRELSCQIFEEAKKFCNQTGVRVAVAYGGAPIVPQLRVLEKGVDILVATPGRLADMIERSRVSLNMIKYLALDEADRMLDMGFEPQIRKIVEEFGMPHPGLRHTMLFSATFPIEIQRLASDFLSDYIFLSVGRVGSSTDLIAQKVEYVEDTEKRNNLMNLLHEHGTRGTNGKNALTLVFVETKRGADSLEQLLRKNGFKATAIHGDKVQFERERALKSFKKGITPILVATDVAARGLDIPHVSHVINYDLPRDIDSYVHRIGRTGRAGKSGLATAFFNDKNMPIAKALADLMQEAHQEVPSWLTQYAETAASFVPSSHGARYGGGKFGGHDFRTDYNNSRNANDNSYSTSFNEPPGGSSNCFSYFSPPLADAEPYPAASDGYNTRYDAEPYPADSDGYNNRYDAEPYPADSDGYNSRYESIAADGWE